MLSTIPRLTASRASSGGVQWLTGSPLSLGCSHASAMMSVTCSGVNRTGPPGRGRSERTSQISNSRSLSDDPACSAATRCASAAAHRSRQRRIRCRSTCNRSACSTFSTCSADISTIRARSARPHGVRRAPVASSRTRRCRSVTATAAAFWNTTQPPRSQIATA
jgi:hypothetical protein